MFEKFLAIFKKDVGAPVHVGANPVYFTNVYFSADSGWIFSWRTAIPTPFGAVTEHWSEVMANEARNAWEARKSFVEHATFVHDGSK
jgi:hypothetical protein